MNKYIISVIGLLLSHSLLFAQFNPNSISIDSLNNLGYDPPLRIYDIEGQEQHPAHLVIQNNGSSLPPSTPPHNNSCNAGIFELFFEDVDHHTGAGFDNTTPANPSTTFPTATTLGEVRQQAICQVFRDLSTFLGSPPATVSSPRVRIKIPPSGNFNGSVTGQGSSYYLVPRGTTAAMLDGEVWKTINLGYDSWSTIPSPLVNSLIVPTNSNVEFFHGYLKLFFNDNTAPTTPLFHYDYNSPNTGNLEDFYSLILHEAVHALGFASLFKGNGFSQLQSAGCQHCYTRYDGYLESTNTATLGQILDDANPLSPSLLLPAGQIAATLAPSCNSSFYDPVRFNGFNHQNQAVFSPQPFSDGSSLSHFACSCPSSSYTGAMLACSQAGGQQRFLNQAEANALCDLGYQRTNAWSIDGNVVMTYTSCTNTPCLAIGANDFLDLTNIQYVTDNNTPITINNILANDLFPAGTTPQILNHTIQILNGGGTVALTGNSLSYTPDLNFVGWAILAYVPSCPNSAMNGNPSYIFIRINAVDPPCDDSDCNLICTGNLEDNFPFYRDGVSFTAQNNTIFYTLGGGSLTIDWHNNSFNGVINPNGSLQNYSPVAHHCPAFNIDGTAPLSNAAFTATNNIFTQITSSNRYNSTATRDGIQLNLIQALDPSQPYTLTFWAIAPPADPLNFPNCTTSPIVHIYGTRLNNLCNPNAPIPLSNTLGGIAANCTQLIGRSNPIPALPNNSNNAQQWNQYTVTIDPANLSNAYDRIYITLQDPLSLGNAQTTAFLDEFELRGDNSIAIEIQTSTPTPFPCIDQQGNMDIITIDYEVCINDPLQIPNATDISLEVDLNGFAVVSGPFNAAGQLTIPANSQTTNCATYSISLAAPSPNSISAGNVLSFPINLTSLGSACLHNNLSTREVDILPIATLPATISKSVSSAPHIIGQPLTYTIEVCNPLPVPLHNLQVTDPLDPNQLNFLAAVSPDFPSSFMHSNGNLILRSAQFSLPAAIGPTSPSCTTLIFQASPLVGATNCQIAGANNHIQNQASLRQFGSFCPPILSNPVDIFPTASTVIPASVTTLTQAINQGLLLPPNLASNTPQQVSIEGSLRMDINTTTYYPFAAGSEITMFPGAEMVIPTEQFVSFAKTHIHGCDKMWKRILVEHGGAIEVSQNSLFEQAEHAIEFQDQSVSYYLTNSIFRDNYISLYTPPNSTPQNIGGIIQKVTFEGTGSANFLPPYTGQNSSPDTWPYAGIHFNDVVALNMVKGTDNVFQNLSIGIQVNQTNLTLRQGAIFRDLKTVASYGAFSNIGVLAQASIVPHQLTVEGFGTSTTSPYAFDNCKYGVFVQGQVNYSILNNAMNLDLSTAIPTPNPSPIGIVALGCKGRKGLVASNKILSSEGGILFYQCDDPLTTLEVTKNEIDLVNGSSFGGITFFENAQAYSPILKENKIRLYDARRGILLLNQAGAIVEANTIELHNDVLSSSLGYIGYSNRTGMVTSGSNNQTLSCNTITGGFVPSPPSFPIIPAYDLSPLGYNNNNSDVFGIQASLSANNNYQCNQFDLIPNGLNIVGTPASSSIKGNRFARVARGLWLSSGAQIGIQSHTGNRWVWSPNPTILSNNALLNLLNIAGAQNDETNPLFIQNSIFRYDINANPNFFPFRVVAIAPAAWFLSSSSNGSSFDCNAASICQQPLPLALVAPNVSTLDQAIVQGNFQPTIFPSTTTFEAQSATYRKLKSDRSLTPAGSAEAAFVHRLAQQGEGAFYSIQEQCAQLHRPSPVQLQQSSHYQQQLEVDLQALYRLDHLALLDSLHRDSLLQLAALKRQNTLRLLQQQRQLFSALQQSSLRKAALAETDNHTIATHHLAESNLKSVHDIYLNTIAKGIFSFGNSQLQQLDAIARQCPLEGGIAVYKARAMVRFFTLVDYEALQQCNTASPAARFENTNLDLMDLLAAPKVKIFPNPSSNYFTIEWKLRTGEAGKLILYNTLGQAIQQIALTGKSGQQRIDISNLATGIYLGKVVFDNQAIHQEKVIIRHP